MPIYEFYSPETNKIYTFFARSVAMSGALPACPDGEGNSMRRVASRFAFVGRAKEPAAAGELGDEGGEDDPRMEAAMAEMEREFGGMDDANPDPRQLGRMMRRMAELTGEKVPAAFDEMVGRLEAGEDPDKLEEEFGDALDDESLWGGEGEPGGGGGLAGARLRHLARRARPVRDPKLYEMRDFLPPEG
ncbi:zinc ribbon domain-containing protein [soil metagenome]